MWSSNGPWHALRPDHYSQILLSLPIHQALDVMVTLYIWHKCFQFHTFIFFLKSGQGSSFYLLLAGLRPQVSSKALAKWKALESFCTVWKKNQLSSKKRCNHSIWIIIYWYINTLEYHCCCCCTIQKYVFTQCLTQTTF